MNEVNVYLFASLRDYTGAKSLKVAIPKGATVADLKELLAKEHPRLVPVREAIMAAINREYAADEQIIPQNAEIALFPPVSGG
jgi:molybdopterin converting factor subunit 1